MISKLIAALFLFSIAIFPQNEDSLYYFTVEGGAGYSYYITTLDIPDLTQGGVSGTIRVMWHPEHLLSLGLETGYSNLYSLKSDLTNPDLGTFGTEVSMASVPVTGLFSMKIFPETFPLLEFKVSTGILLLYNTIKSSDVEKTTSQISIGYAVAGTYLVPLNDLFSLGGELKYQYISKIQDADLSLQLMLSYAFLKY